MAWTKTIVADPTAENIPRILEFERNPDAFAGVSAQQKLVMQNSINVWRKNGKLPPVTGAAKDIGATEAGLIHAGSQFAKQGIGAQENARRGSNALLLSMGAQSGVVPEAQMQAAADQVNTPMSPEGTAEVAEINRILAPVSDEQPIASGAGNVAPYLAGMGVGTGIRAGIAEGAGQALNHPEMSTGTGAVAGGVGGVAGRMLRGSPNTGTRLDKAGYEMLPSQRQELRREMGEPIGPIDSLKDKFARFGEEPLGVVNPIEAAGRRGTAGRNQRNFDNRTIEYIAEGIGIPLTQKFRRGSEYLRADITKKVDGEYTKVTSDPTLIPWDEKLLDDLIAWQDTHQRAYTRPQPATDSAADEVLNWIQGRGKDSPPPTIKDIVDYGKSLSHEAWGKSGDEQAAVYALRSVLDAWGIRGSSVTKHDLTQARHSYHLAELLNASTKSDGHINPEILADQLRKKGNTPSNTPLLAEADFMKTTNPKLRSPSDGSGSLLPAGLLTAGALYTGAEALGRREEGVDSSMGAPAAFLGLALASSLIPRVTSRLSKPGKTAIISRMYGDGLINPSLRAARMSQADELRQDFSMTLPGATQ
mgnify:CR=1 FL=1